MNANLAAIAYIVSGVLFILALRGLSSPETSRQGNRNGMIGMAIAVGTALLTLWGQGALDPVTIGLIAAGVAAGGAVGAGGVFFFKRLICLIIMKMMNAKIAKLTATVMKLP